MQNNQEFIIIVIMILVGLILFLGGVYVFNSLRKKWCRLKSELLNVRNVINLASQMGEGVDIKDIFEETPKSVSSMTKLMEPQITRDFPEFSWAEFKHKAENMLISALLAISSENIEHAEELSDEVVKQLENTIKENKLSSVKETYSNIQIHQTEIANYEKKMESALLPSKVQLAIFTTKKKMKK